NKDEDKSEYPDGFARFLLLLRRNESTRSLNRLRIRIEHWPGLLHRGRSVRRGSRGGRILLRNRSRERLNRSRVARYGLRSRRPRIRRLTTLRRVRSKSIGSRLRIARLRICGIRV